LASSLMRKKYVLKCQQDSMFLNFLQTLFIKVPNKLECLTQCLKRDRFVTQICLFFG
jgi:hypothetical protein